MSASTRSESIDPIYGKAQPLSKISLPTIEDVMKACHWERNLKKVSIEPQWVDVRNEVCEQVQQIWISASIPTVTLQCSRQMLDKCHSNHKSLMRSYKRDKDKPNYREKCEKMINESKLLFDIAACKCTEPNHCSCPKDMKVPNEEKGFLQDQRNNRKMMIGSIDAKCSNRRKKNINT